MIVQEFLNLTVGMKTKHSDSVEMDHHAVHQVVYLSLVCDDEKFFMKVVVHLEKFSQ